jgi:hypothetical protein
MRFASAGLAPAVEIGEKQPERVFSGRRERQWNERRNREHEPDHRHPLVLAAADKREWLGRLARNLLIDDYRKNKLERASDSLDERLPKIENTRAASARADDIKREAEHLDN